MSGTTSSQALRQRCRIAFPSHPHHDNHDMLPGSDLSFNLTSALEPPLNEPAEDRPDEAGGPAGEDVGRVVDSHIDPTDSHQAGQEHGQREDVELEPSAMDELD